MKGLVSNNNAHDKSMILGENKFIVKRAEMKNTACYFFAYM